MRQPFVYRKAAAGEEFEGRGRHRPADEIELLQQKVANLETLLETERGLASELRRDKEAYLRA